MNQAVMKSFSRSFTVIAVIIIIAITKISRGDMYACKSCNCHFDNVQVLDNLIEAKIRAALTG